jgi:hypothetical protein
MTEARAITRDDLLAPFRVQEELQPKILQAMKGCRSCGAPVFMAVTTNGKRMPVDTLPKPEGRFTIRRDEMGNFVATYIDRHTLGMLEQHPDGKPDAYVSHFATCPNADQHRKPRRR